MKLRKDDNYESFSLIICSDATRLIEYEALKPEEIEGMKLIKIGKTRK